MKLFLKNLLIIVLLLIFNTITFAQHVPSTERANAKLRRQAQMEGNQVRTSIFNHGQTGRETGEVPISEQTPYEWPKNSGKVYLALTGIFVGGEVVDDNGDMQRIIDVCNYKSSPQGGSWNFEPVAGYFNEAIPTDEQTIANSVDPNTWPAFWPDKMTDDVDPGWPGSWNGFFGKNKFNADQEIFYRASDDLYDDYDYYFPDSTDLTRKGLGIILDVRVLAWSQVLVEDVVYILHNVKNDGTKDIEKVGITIWHADFVGGDGDSQDDISEFDLMEDIAWSRDLDHRAPTFGSDPVGIVGVAFLETPGNALDRIDNDGDGEENSPIVSENLLLGEDPSNLIDDNNNGLIDENQTHIPFQDQLGVGYADGIDANFNAEENSPLVTATMVSDAQTDPLNWKRWPPDPENDAIQNGQVHLLMVEGDDETMAFKDYIDNNDNGEMNSDTITQAIIDVASADAPYYRYNVPSTNIILYDVKQEDLGKKYADGIDNDNNGAIDENIDEGIDEMIDEARDNGIDDDGDWNPLTDDVGLDGVEGTGDTGEGDGMPTGARNGLPGEPNVDATDVSETDQIGLTNAQYIPAGGLNINSDPTMWFDFMIPGKFYNPALVVAGEYDLFVSSSFFPLKAGQTEPISIAVILGNGPVPDVDGEFRKQNVLKKRLRAQETYNNDYQFANAPLIPTLTAVTGNNRVTLYWDEIAEQSFDDYINNIGGIGNDFEGYRIYRTTDPAFEDVFNVTDAFGTLVFKTPIAQFDLDDGYFGIDSVGLDGAHFYLGNNTGLQHVWIDSTAKNGFTYYYAITSYDFGFPAGGITPTECPIRISLKGDGSVKLGSNVVQVTPEAPSAGYIPPSLSEIELISGTTTGIVSYEIVDDTKILDNHVYYITFEDTLIIGAQDILTTLNFTLTDSTIDSVLIDRSTQVFDESYEQPLLHGFRLSLRNEESVQLNKTTSKWNNPDSIPDFVFQKFTASGGLKGVERPNDYFLVFGDVGLDTSISTTIGSNTFGPVPVNFMVYNVSEQRFIDFAFLEVDLNYGLPGELSASGARKDRILFMEPNAQDSLVWTWWFYLSEGIEQDSIYRIPQSGDSAFVFLNKPFLSPDVFRFVTSAEKIDKQLAKSDLDKIRVVPNPYVATALWEPQNPYNSGRGPRSIHFTHLPAECKIRIFTINGELVDKIDHKTDLNDGAAHWDMLTKDNLSISYGVYIYHIDAPGIGEKMGKFAVIK